MLPALAIPLGSLFAATYAASLVPRQAGGLWGGINITAEVLGVQAAISSPICVRNVNCTAFVAWIPQCLRVQGSPGCWCANPDPMHYCALCMSNPVDASTTPEQTQLALTSHQEYHVGCGAYFAFINASLTSTSSALPSTTSEATSAIVTTPATSATAVAANSGSGSSLNSGALAGIVVGGVIGLALIVAGAWLLYRHMQNTHEQKVAAVSNDPNRGSAFGGRMEDGSKFGTPAITPMALSDNGRSPHLLPQRQSTMGTTGGSPPPPFNLYSPTQGPPPAGQPNPRESTLSYDTSVFAGSNVGQSGGYR